MRILRFLVLALWLPLAATAETRVTPQDLSQVLQAVLDHPALAPFLHPEAPGRVPVKVTGIVPRNASVRKFGKPVEFLEKPDSETVLIVRELTMQGTQATLVLVYPIEGVSGRFKLSLSNGTWTVDSASILEH